MPTSIVNQTIESLVTRHGCLNQLLNLCDLGNVAAREVSLAWPISIHFDCERCATLFISRTEDDFRAGSNERANTAFADSTTAAGDDDDSIRVDHGGLPHGGDASISNPGVLKGTNPNLLTATLTTNRIRCSLPVTMRSGSTLYNLTRRLSKSSHCFSSAE